MKNILHDFVVSMEQNRGLSPIRKDLKLKKKKIVERTNVFSNKKINTNKRYK